MEAIMIEKEASIIVHESNPSRRLGRFLTPSHSSSSPSSDPPIIALRSNHLNLANHVSFTGWKNPLRKWNDWVHRMEPLHHATWRGLGIYDAIISSTYRFKVDTQLVLALSERFCPETNSFMFPWGEATVSLEDVMVLGGYPVLGRSVIAPIEPQEEEEYARIDGIFNKARADMNKTRAKKVSQGMWIEAFMESSVEHEAFLVLWLSRQVFPFSRDVVGKQFHKMAFALAKGTRLALGPAVLACLYRDLSSLKVKMIGFSEGRLELWSQMQLVQIWAWERFPKLQPQPGSREEGEPRMARWREKETGIDIKYAIEAMDGASVDFLWRPYATSENFMFYPEEELWVLISPDMQEELTSFVKFIRVCELVGLKCVEPYFPHRVSKQFGMDQDIPGKVTHLSNGEVWKNFNRPIRDEKLYIPSRVYESAITRRYVNWFENSNSVQENVVEPRDGIFLGTGPSSLEKNEAIVNDSTTSGRPKVKRPVIPKHPPGFEPREMEPPNEATRVSESGNEQLAKRQKPGLCA